MWPDSGDPEAEPDDYASLMADRDTLHTVTDELVALRLEVRAIAGGLSKTAPRSLAAGASWVQLDRRAARRLLALVDDQ